MLVTDDRETGRRITPFYFMAALGPFVSGRVVVV
jgi:hypothetical protein